MYRIYFYHGVQEISISFSLVPVADGHFCVCGEVRAGLLWINR